MVVERESSMYTIVNYYSVVERLFDSLLPTFYFLELSFYFLPFHFLPLYFIISTSTAAPSERGRDAPGPPLIVGARARCRTKRHGQHGGARFRQLEESKKNKAGLWVRGGVKALTLSNTSPDLSCSPRGQGVHVPGL